MTISFTNPGEIDMTALSIMGLSAKKGDSPIGRFGTGLKYAVAITLRLGGKITIWSGTTRHRFALKTRDFRGKTLSQVTMQTGDSPPIDLPFTLDYGQDWEAWQAMRELESNCRDEGGTSSASKVEPVAGTTTIWVDCEAIEEAYANLPDYFITGTPIETSTEWEIYEWRGEPSTKVFYRGVYVGNFEHPTRFCYNFLKGISLSEDRMLASGYSFIMPSKLSWIALESKNVDYLRSILTCNGFQEAKPSLPSGSFSFAQAFHATVDSYITEGRANLVNTAYLHYHYRCTKKDELMYTKHELTSRERALLKGVKQVIEPHYPDLPALNIVADLPNDVLGLQAGDKLYISKRAFDMGEGTLLGTILEEYWHWKQGFTDESRAFQNFLIDRIATLMLELHFEREDSK